MTSLGLGRRRPSHLAFVPWQQQFGIGPLGQDIGRTLANELYHGGFPPTPVEIPIDWIQPPIQFKHDPPISIGEVSQTGGPTARAVNEATIAASAGRAWKFAATIDSVTAADASALAQHAVDVGTMPRPRSAVITLVLNGRAETEIWRILGVTQGRRISLTRGPAPTLVAADAFGRIVSSTWSTADTLQPYTTAGGSASDHSVSGGAGLQSAGTVNVLRSATLDVGATDMTHTVTVSLPVNNAATSTITQWICARLADLSNYYVARLDLSTAGVLTLALFKRVGGVLAAALAGPVVVGSGHIAGDLWRVTIDVYRSQIRSKAWQVTGLSTEPDWQLSATDTDLTTGIGIGLISRLEAGNTNTLPVVVAWDDLAVTTPTRNPWPAGATEHIVSGISHRYENDARIVEWTTSPVVGAELGESGPWFYTEASLTTGTDTVPA